MKNRLLTTILGMSLLTGTIFAKFIFITSNNLPDGTQIRVRLYDNMNTKLNTFQSKISSLAHIDDNAVKICLSLTLFDRMPESCGSTAGMPTDPSMKHSIVYDISGTFQQNY